MLYKEVSDCRTRLVAQRLVGKETFDIGAFVAFQRMIIVERTS
jgi:hypothetical protein